MVLTRFRRNTSYVSPCEGSGVFILPIFVKALTNKFRDLSPTFRFRYRTLIKATPLPKKLLQKKSVWCENHGLNLSGLKLSSKITSPLRKNPENKITFNKIQQKWRLHRERVSFERRANVRNDSQLTLSTHSMK